MSGQIGLLSFAKNELIFSDQIQIDQDVDVGLFSFKVISENRLVIIENFKKIVVLVNEVFTVEENQFAFVLQDRDFHVLRPRQHEPNHTALIESKFSHFIKTNVLNLRHMDLFFLKNALISMAWIGFVVSLICALFFDENRISKGFPDENQFQIQKSVYQSYLNIVSSAVNVPVSIANVSLEKEKQNPKSDQGHIVADDLEQKKFNHKRSTQRTHKEKNTEFDAELSYFMNIIHKNKADQK